MSTPPLMTLETLERLLPACWGEDTSADPAGWTPGCPAHGQCAVTALCVEACLGGEMLWCRALTPDGAGASHYVNLVEGRVVDLTAAQFPAGTAFQFAPHPRAGAFPTYRAYALSAPDTARRYHLLRDRLRAALARPRESNLPAREAP